MADALLLVNSFERPAATSESSGSPRSPVVLLSSNTAAASTDRVQKSVSVTTKRTQEGVVSSTTTASPVPDSVAQPFAPQPVHENIFGDDSESPKRKKKKTSKIINPAQFLMKTYSSAKKNRDELNIEQETMEVAIWEESRISSPLQKGLLALRSIVELELQLMEKQHVTL